MQLKIVVSNEWTFEVNLIKGPNKAGMNLILTKKLLPVAGEKSIIGKSVAEVAPIGSQSIGGQQQGPVNQRGSHRKKKEKRSKNKRKCPLGGRNEEKASLNYSSCWLGLCWCPLLASWSVPFPVSCLLFHSVPFDLILSSQIPFPWQNWTFVSCNDVSSNRWRCLGPRVEDHGLLLSSRLWNVS